MWQWFIIIKMINDLIATVNHGKFGSHAKFRDRVLKKITVIIVVVGQKNRYVLVFQIVRANLLYGEFTAFNSQINS